MPPSDPRTARLGFLAACAIVAFAAGAFLVKTETLTEPWAASDTALAGMVATTITWLSPL